MLKFSQGKSQNLENSKLSSYPNQKLCQLNIFSDIRRCYTLFLDEKRSTDYLKEYQQHFLYGSNVDDDTLVPKMEIA